jgi:predicted  nucleic acid-binding Zn-ribbon protein
VIQRKIERTFNQVNDKSGAVANRVETVESKVEKTFNQANANAAALPAELDGISAQVIQLQADLDEVKKALGIVEG